MELTVNIPEKYIVNYSPDELKLLLKLNTAIDMYRSGQISSGAAIEFVGEIDRFEFLYECKKRGIEPQTYESADELEAEVAMLDQELP
jgi:predicted HTH domain antitoxin